MFVSGWLDQSPGVGWRLGVELASTQGTKATIVWNCFCEKKTIQMALVFIIASTFTFLDRVSSSSSG